MNAELLHRRRMMTGTNRLPPGYKKVEYIRTTTSCFARLDYYANTKSTFLELDYYKDLQQASNWQPIVGQENSIRYGIYSSNTTYYNVGMVWLGPERNDVYFHWKWKVGERQKVYFGDGITKVNDNILSTLKTGANLTSAYSLLFNAAPTNDIGGTRGTYSRGNLYYIKIYEYDTLVRYYVPCRREEDNNVGLFEIFTQIYHGKSGGSGAFIAGPDV